LISCGRGIDTAIEDIELGHAVAFGGNALLKRDLWDTITNQTFLDEQQQGSYIPRVGSRIDKNTGSIAKIDKLSEGALLHNEDQRRIVHLPAFYGFDLGFFTRLSTY
jgi:hypothetical protein